jgi:hypothetical protein
MGSSFFSGKGSAAMRANPSSGMNMEARAIGAGGYAARAAGGARTKDLAVAKAFMKNPPKATTGTAASNARGPKRI